MIEQSGVADCKDAEDRLRTVCDASVSAISTENLEALVILKKVVGENTL